MTRTKNSLGSRTLALFLSFVMIASLIPFNMMTVIAIAPVYGTLSAITAGGTVTNADGDSAEATYSGSTVLNWSAKDPLIGRTVDGWWVGLKMTAPDKLKAETDFTGVTLKSKGSSGVWSDPYDFWSVKDSGDGDTVHYVGLWGVVNEERLIDALTSGNDIKYEWKFDWDADGSYEQLASLVIKPDGIVLKKDGETVYPTSGFLGETTAFTSGLTVTNGGDNSAFAEFTSAAELKWTPADASIGRTVDGWWVGLKVEAPDALKAETDFDGVTLKVKGSSNEWSDAMPFWSCKDSSDSDTKHFVGLWSLVTEAYLENALTSGKNIDYFWKFDWNKDGVYEQQVKLSIDPSKIILVDADENRVYPPLGTVIPYADGTLSGVTGNITVTVDNVTLDWSPKDPSIGRTVDAWWYGLKMIAPDSSAEILKHSKLKYQTYNSDHFSDPLSFWACKDSADSDAFQYVGLWVPLTPAKLAEAKENGENLITDYWFDWDNDDTYEQKVRLIIIPGDGIVLNQVEQTGFRFEIENPVDQWTGQTFTNKAVGGQAGDITYEITQGEDIASINAATGEVTFKDAGKIKVKATRAGDDTYKPANAEYTVRSFKYPQDEFKFETASPDPIAYEEGKTFTNKAIGGSGEGKITYSIIGDTECAEIDANTGVVTIKKTGSITVKAEKAFDAHYEETTTTYILTIEQGQQDALTFSKLPDDNKLTYKLSEYVDAVAVTGGSGEGKIKFSVVEGNDVATVTEDGKINTLKAGTFKLRAEKEEDENYLAADPVEVTLEVTLAPQTTFAFTYPMPNNVTYNENGNKFENPAIGGESGGDITYAIGNPGGESIVDVGADGTLTIKRSGTVTIIATKAADDKYDKKTVEYTLTIDKAEQTFTFADGTGVSKYYGIKTYRNDVVCTALTDKADGLGYGSGKITYTLTGDSIGASIAADGTITFADSALKVGTIKITALKEKDNCYNECSKEYTLTVSYLPAPAEPFTLSGEKRNDSGWYTDNITITPADGYRISYGNELSTDDWASSVIYTREGVNSENIYLINNDGSITDAIPVNNMMIDKADPSDVNITYSTSLLDKVIETVTFGVYNAPVEVTLTATNVNSGIKAFVYNYNGEDVTAESGEFDSNENGVAVYSFTIAPEYRGVVTMKAMTVSGRIVELTGQKTLVVDSVKPECSVSYQFASGESREENGTIYTQGETTVYFEITEDNFDISDKPVLKIDGIEAALTWTKDPDTGKREADVTVSAAGTHTISLAYTDTANNAMTAYEKSLVIDSTAPVVVSMTYDNNTAFNTKYYNSARTATIVISEDYFMPEEFELDVFATDAAGIDLELTESYNELLKDPDEWTSSGSIHTAHIEFSADAVYYITVNYTDLSGNVMTGVTDEFVVDTSAPTGLEISFSTPIVEKVIEALTFGFYKASVEVTLQADDETAGVDHFVWTYTKEAGASGINKATTDKAQIASENITYTNNGKTATATFTIDANARGYIEADVYDRSGNSSNGSEPTLIKVADNKDPVVTVTYTSDEANVRYTDAELKDVTSFAASTNAFFDKDVKALITIDEANFFEGVTASDGVIYEVGILLTKTDNDGGVTKTEYLPEGAAQKYADATPQTFVWNTDGDVHTFEITYSDDADYVLTVEYADFSANESAITADDGITAVRTYESKIITVDKTDPVMEVTFEPYEPVQTLEGRDYLDKATTATIKITEHNFRADDAAAVFTAKDSAGGDVTTADFAAYLADRASWTKDGNTYTAQITFDVDANYTFDIDYTDLAKRGAADFAGKVFTVDAEKPAEVEISYSVPVLEKVIETLTFGFYKADVTVTVTANDATSGIDHFVWSYTKDGASDKNAESSENNVIASADIKYDGTGKATASFKIDENARGSITVTAVNRSGCSTTLSDENKIVVVDKIAPQISVEYTSEEADVRYTDKENNDAADFASASNAYFNKDVKATITIDEANFFEGKEAQGTVVHEVGILLTKTDNDGVVTKTEYLPKDAVQKYAEAGSETLTWTTTGDIHTFEITLSDEADYVLEIEYTDFSENEATINSNDGNNVNKKYISKVITVDKTAPTVEVTFSPYEVSQSIGGRDYLTTATVADITVTEHNFRADEIAAAVIAKDSAGADTAVSDFAGYLSDRANWTKNGNTYTAQITFSADANYTFDIEYTDLAVNKAEDYAEKSFTVDTASPVGLSITYSTPVIEKIIETLTFGFYKASVEVTLQADDETAGVDHFVWTYTKEAGASGINKATTDKAQIASENITYTNNGKTATATFTIDANARGYIEADVYDRSGNSSNGSEPTLIKVADNKDPVVTVTYTSDEANVRYTDAELKDVTSFAASTNAFFDKDVKALITIDEANFFEGVTASDGVIYEVGILLTKTDNDGGVTKTEYLPEGAAQKYADATPQTFVWNTDGDVHTFEITYSDDADYVLTVEYADFSANESAITADDGITAVRTYESKIITVDKTDPVMEVTFEPYEPVQTLEGRDYLDKATTATIKITEHNFRADDAAAVFTAKDSAGGDVTTADFAAYLADRASWTKDGNTYTAQITFDVDANYTFDIDYTDLAKRGAADFAGKVFTVDTEAPANLSISYSTHIKFWDKILNAVTFGYYSYNPSVEVTLQADDLTAVTDHFEWTYTREDAASTTKNVESRTAVITADEITYSNGGKTATVKFVLTGTDAEQFRGSISFDVYDRSGNKSTTSDFDRINIVDTISPTRSVAYSAARAMDTVTLTDIETYTEADHDHVKLYYENEAVITFTVEEANFYSEDVIIKVNDAAVSPTDWTQNGDVWTGTITISGDGDYTVTMEYKDRSGNTMESYVSPIIAIDNTDPTISVAYDPAEASANGKYFKTDRSMTVTVVEHNFRADDIAVTVTAKDAGGAPVANEESAANAIADYLRDRASWTKNEDTYTATVPFTVDAHYDVTINYSDLIGNAAAQYTAPSFAVDHAAPGSLKISYSKEIRTWDKILNAVTFGYYSYNPTVEVTMTAFDEISGVDYFTWTYTQEEGTSTTKNVSSRTVVIKSDEISYSEDNKTATAKFTLTGTDAEQFRGSVSFTATDRASNESSKYDDKARINVVDTISPERTVTYSDAKQVVDASTLQTRTEYEYSKEKTNAILYYDDDVTVTVKITEANFYPEDVVIKDNDTAVKPGEWTQNGDEWTAEFKLTGEGDHIVSMTYTDRSENKMTEYESQRIIIDRTAPVIDVQYGNTDVKNTVRDNENHDRDYFDKIQTATVTIKEHNFRPDDVIIRVKAKDVVSSNVGTFTFDADGNVTKYAEEGRSREEWAKLTPYTDNEYRRGDDTFKLVIEYANDANYTFDIEYKDLALNTATEYPTDYFTVDKTAPEKLDVSYSTNVFENVLESVTFGYYNAQMTVTITAEDDISGIYHFLYSYVKSEGVSGVNAELIDEAIRMADIDYNGAKATATFTIPKFALINDNQFNGTVRFTAFDRAENKTDMSDTERIIVDNIKPTWNVTYSDPVQVVNNISYYADTASVKVDISEANFYEEDVSITVTKDGESYSISDLKWDHVSVDEHSGTFTLPENGDYIVSVTYTDRSGNVMDNYRSDRITVDKTKPTVSVTNIKNNTANKDETYSFTVTANDTNINYETFKPELKALTRNEDGNYTVKTIPLGDVATVEAGKTYSFTVQNLEEDAAYTLTCAVKDMSGNEYRMMKLEDGSEYETVRFSINRNGSTFDADKYVSGIVEQYYIYRVENDIVLEEINVDPIESFTVKLNGKELEENKDYTTTLSTGEGEWSKRTYVIKKELFDLEGEYNIVIESTDKATTKAYSDVKNLKIAFVVDRTEPVLTVSGVEEGGRYQVDEQIVTVIPTDDGGRLYSFKAEILDSNGNPLTKDGNDISVRFEMSGEEFIKYLEENEGKISFTVPEGLENQVRLTCNDCAARSDGSTNEYAYTYTRVTVSQSGWIIFYANKPLFYGSIGGVVGVAGIATALTVILKKKKKINKEASK